MSNHASSGKRKGLRDSATRARTKPSVKKTIFLIPLVSKLHQCDTDAMWDQQGPLSPQLDEPVEDEEDEKAEEEHVAQEFGLAASGELLDPADGGAQQAPRGVKVWVLEIIRTV